jgi:hypothetical protein
MYMNGYMNLTANFRQASLSLSPDERAGIYAGIAGVAVPIAGWLYQKKG